MAEIDTRHPLKARTSQIGEELAQVYNIHLLKLEAEFAAGAWSQEDYDVLSAMLRHDIEAIELRLRLIKI